MIGVFDSGFGGLTILKEFMDLLPQYDYTYLGDNARAPYGNRSHEAVKKFTEEGVKYLMEQGCSLVIIACNTASSNVLRELQQEMLVGPDVRDKKILGVIRPMVEYAVKATKNGNIGVVGTRSTINAKSYETEIKKLNPATRVISRACPLLVPLIEEGWHEKPEARMILRKYLRDLKNANIDTLILGCTHYPFMYKNFCGIMGKNVGVPHPGKIVAGSLKDYLSRHPEIEKGLTKNGTRSYLTTDDAVRFKEIGGKFLNAIPSNAKKVGINK
jgi:glutamate racemase